MYGDITEIKSCAQSDGAAAESCFASKFYTKAAELGCAAGRLCCCFVFHVYCHWQVFLCLSWIYRLTFVCLLLSWTAYAWLAQVW